MHLWYDEVVSFESSATKWKTIRRAVGERDRRIVSDALSSWYWTYYVECAKAIGLQHYKTRRLANFFDSLKSTMHANKAKVTLLHQKHAHKRLATNFYSYLLSTMISKEQISLHDISQQLRIKKRAIDEHLGHQRIMKFHTICTKNLILQKLLKSSMAKRGKLRKLTNFSAWKHFSDLRKSALKTADKLTWYSNKQSCRKVLLIWRSICNQKIIVYNHVQASIFQENSNSKAVAFRGFVCLLNDAKHNKKIANSKIYRQKLIALRRVFAELSANCQRRRILKHFIGCRIKNKQNKKSSNHFKAWAVCTWRGRMVRHRMQRRLLDMSKVHFARWKNQRRRFIKKIASQDLERSHTVKLLQDTVTHLEMYRNYKKRRRSNVIKARQNEFHVVVWPCVHLWRMEAQATRIHSRRQPADVECLRSCWNAMVTFSKMCISTSNEVSHRRNVLTMTSAFQAWQAFVGTNWQKAVRANLASEFCLKRSFSRMRFGVHLNQTRSKAERTISSRHSSALMRSTLEALRSLPGKSVRWTGSSGGATSTYLGRMIEENVKMFLRLRLLKYFFYWKEQRLVPKKWTRGMEAYCGMLEEEERQSLCARYDVDVEALLERLGLERGGRSGRLLQEIVLDWASGDESFNLIRFLTLVCNKWTGGSVPSELSVQEVKLLPSYEIVRVVHGDYNKVKLLLPDLQDRNALLCRLERAMVRNLPPGMSPFPAWSCPRLQAAREFVLEALSLHESYLDLRGDHEEWPCAFTKRKGNPARLYAAPEGWVRVGLRVDPILAKRHGVWEDWNVCYHGTRRELVGKIVESRMLLLPGNQNFSGKLVSADQYYPPFIDLRESYVIVPNSQGPDIIEKLSSSNPYHSAARGAQELQWEKFFVTSPSILYASRYFAKTFTWRNRKAQVVLQGRQCPQSLRVMAYKSLMECPVVDKNFSNSELNWFSNVYGSIILTGILFRFLD
eukprot:767963-Hanusia_phi.AAC.5